MAPAHLLMPTVLPKYLTSVMDMTLFFPYFNLPVRRDEEERMGSLCSGGSQRVKAEPSPAGASPMGGITHGRHYLLGDTGREWLI